ncbi:MAG TPA: hypothetical protein VIF62_21310 [Labilithrix sp.]|jgi:cell wall-associated NlpC family hydrolase
MACRIALLLFLSISLSIATVACSAEVDDEEAGDVGDTSDDLISAACSKSIVANVSGARRTALDRGLAWFDARVPYSQSRTHDGYRTDCSGFVSMAWQLGTSYTTASFATGAAQNTLLASYDQLLPGDAIVHRSGGAGHVVLFAGWQDAAKSTACVIEEENTKLGMQFHVRTAASLRAGGFKPIRAKKLVAATAGDAPPPQGDDACAADGDCNPGNDGSGLVCSAGQCVPGCRTDAQCPGVKTCVSGQCR